MRKLIVAAAFAGLMLAGAARAEDCGDPGSATAQLLPPAEVQMTGFSISAQMGLEPASYPLKDIREAASPCRRADFTAGRDTWTLFGGADSQPPRWAMINGKTNRVIALAAMPWPKDAEAWARNNQNGGSGEVSFDRMAVALIIAEGDKRRVFVLYDATPTDEVLIRHMTAALNGEIKPFATYNVRKHALE